MLDIEEVLHKVDEAKRRAQDILEFESDFSIGKDASTLGKPRYDESIYARRDGQLMQLVPVLRVANLALHGFATLDTSLIEGILALKEDLRRYRKDPSLKRPFNVLMIAPPGSGKSHLVNCLSKEMDFPSVLADLSSGRPYDLINYALNEARNIKAQDRIPIIFLDEVDSDLKVLPSLLPLLWEGQFSTTGQILNVGKCVIICAVSDREISDALRSNNQLGALSKKHPKLPDFFSRFSGGTIKIRTLCDRERKLDRLAIAAALIRKRFRTVNVVSIGLLQFLTELQVRHEVRSMEALINLLPKSAVKTWEFVSSPDKENAIPSWGPDLYSKFVQLFNSSNYSNSLWFHLCYDSMTEALDIWNNLCLNIDPVRIDA